MKNHDRLGLMLLASFMTASAALAQVPPPAPAWGTSSLSSEYISAWDLLPDNSGTTYATNLINGYRFVTNSGSFYAGVHVPNGARIVWMEMEACDYSTTGSVDAALFKTTALTGEALVGVGTGVAEATECSRWANELLAPETVDTGTYSYFVNVHNFPLDGTATIGGIRIFYELQVSPAPVVATFGDVPTGHPFFQFIEALAASGITAGCGGGNFCPDAPLTRGQMAVFLAKALGLHWPAELWIN